MTIIFKPLAVAILVTGALAAPLAASAANTTGFIVIAAGDASGLNLMPDNLLTDVPDAAIIGLDPDSPANHPLFATSRSPAPEPATWAIMLMGFGGAGSLLRRRAGGAMYRLVEALPTGEEIAEEFSAPDDATALRRAALVAEGQIQLWRGDIRIAPGTERLERSTVHLNRRSLKTLVSR